MFQHFVNRFFSRLGPDKLLDNVNCSYPSHDLAATSLAQQLFEHMLDVMQEPQQLNIGDFDLKSLRENIVGPVAEYLSQDDTQTDTADTRRLPKDKQQATGQRYVRPIFISGEPGIGKTTLLMVLDEALIRLALPGSGGPSCRDLVAKGQIGGYFADKGIVSVIPLRLFGTPTALLSARDWNNILRHWTYDETVGRQSSAALADFARQMRAKVVIIDEAELEGYVYFTETLAERGVLVLLSSNLPVEHVHLAADRVNVVTLRGPDHRTGDLASVVLAQDAPGWFDVCDDQQVENAPLLAGAAVIAGKVSGKSFVCIDWISLRDRPLLKDDFAWFFRDYAPDFVLLDSVPFFTEPSTDEVDLTFLGHLFRFVNLVDAIHDCQLPLVVRGTHHGTLDSHVVGPQMKATLEAYDNRTGDRHGQAAWIEWTRCLSRLRSREAFNDAMWGLLRQAQ